MFSDFAYFGYLCFMKMSFCVVKYFLNLTLKFMNYLFFMLHKIIINYSFTFNLIGNYI